MRGFLMIYKKFFNASWPFLIIGTLVVIFFYPVFFKGLVPLPLDALVGAHVPWTEVKWPGYPAGVPIKNLEISDTFSQFYPWRLLAGEYWKAGKVPLWNPYMFSGTPFLAMLQPAVFYPLNFLYVFLFPINAWTVVVISQIFLSLVFMYLFLNSFNLPKLASLLGAIIFSFSGYMIGWLEFTTGSHAGLWLPLLLLMERKFLISKKFYWVSLISLTFFMVYTAGDFQVPLYVSVVYLAYAFYFGIKNKKNIFWLMVGLAGGILLSSIQLIPTLELYLNSIRKNDSYIKEFNFGLLDWSKILNFIWPDFFGNVVTGNYWGRFTYHEYIGFAGATSLVFTVFSIVSKKSNVEKFFLFVLILALLMAFPTPLGLLPYKLNLPGLSTSSASRIIYLIDFSLAVLSAFGFSRIFNSAGFNSMKKLKALYRIVVFFLSFSLLVFLFLFYIWHFDKEFFIAGRLFDSAKIKVAIRNMIPTTLVFLGIGAFLFLDIFLKRYNFFPKYIKKNFLPVSIVFITVFELLRFGWKNTPFSSREFLFPSTATIDFLKSQEGYFRIVGGIPTNLFMPYKIESAEGYASLYPSISAKWISAINSGEDFSSVGRYGLINNFSSPLLDYENVRYVVDFRKGRSAEAKNGGFNSLLVESRYKKVFEEGRVGVFENTHSLPRVWLSTKYKVVFDDREVVKELLSIDSAKRILIVDSQPDLEISEKEDFGYKIEYFEESYNKVKVEVFSSENSLLFLSQTYYPGWKVFVDGKENKIIKANYKYQAVAFPKGKHIVEWYYQPNSFKIGVALSFATLIFLTGSIFLNQIKYGKR
jgi:hypothetical protein